MTDLIRRTILIVDDSESICNVLGKMLNVHGYETVLAHDGEQGVRATLEQRPHLILLDIMMPVLDGWGMMERLRSNPATVDVPVIAMTALPLSEQRVREAGFTGYLSKPITTHRLREEIRNASTPRP